MDDPHDAGGRTNEGVTQRVFAAWLNNQDPPRPPRDVWTMNGAERDAIYRGQYWTKIKGDDLPGGLDLVLLDSAVNSGPAQAVKWLQRALGGRYGGHVDGIMGEATFAAVKTINDMESLIDAVMDRRLAFCQALKTWGRFGKGWAARIKHVRETGVAWAVGGVAPTLPVIVEPTHHKADIADAKHIPSASPGAGAGSIGATVAVSSQAAVSWLGQLKAQIAAVSFLPHADQVATTVDHAAAVVGSAGGIAGLIVAAAGGAYFAYARRAAASLHAALDTDPATAGATPAGAV